MVQPLSNGLINYRPKGKSKRQKRERQANSTRNFWRKSELLAKAKTSKTLGEKGKRDRE